MFDNKDLENLKQFRHVVGQGDFKLRGDAVIMAANLLVWFNNLEAKIKDAIEYKEKKEKEDKLMGSKNIKRNPISKSE